MTRGGMKRNDGLRFLRVYVLVCLRDDINLFHLLREAKSGLQIVKYSTSPRDIGYTCLGLLVSILHINNLNFVKFSFKYRMYLLSWVLCL